MGSSKCYMIWCRSKQFVVTIMFFFAADCILYRLCDVMGDSVPTSDKRETASVNIRLHLPISRKNKSCGTSLYLMVWLICVCGVLFRNRERCCLYWLQKQIPPILALYYLSKTGGMPVSPVAHSSWIFWLKTFQNFDQWKFRSWHFFQLPYWLQLQLLASYLNAILIDRKALHNYFFANCAYYLLVNRCNRSLRFIDPPTVCQKYVHTRVRLCW